MSNSHYRVGSAGHSQIGTLFCLALMAGSASAESGNFEMTPYAAYSFGGKFSDAGEATTASLQDSESVGLLLNLRNDANTQWEVLYSRQATSATLRGAQTGELDIDVHYLQVGGTYQGEGGRVRPYLAATIGATHFDVRSGGYDSDTFFSFSLGPGLQIRPSERLGLRLEARAFGSLVRSGSDIFCLSDPASMTSACAITVSGEVLWQTQVMAGIVFRF
jgi:opacity protein-like surface antigen